MANRTIEWLRHSRTEWQESIDLMEKGIMHTGDLRSGKPVDTTAETIEKYKSWIADADKLIDAHEAKGE